MRRFGCRNHMWLCSNLLFRNALWETFCLNIDNTASTAHCALSVVPSSLWRCLLWSVAIRALVRTCALLLHTPIRSGVFPTLQLRCSTNKSGEFGCAQRGAGRCLGCPECCLLLMKRRHLRLNYNKAKWLWNNDGLQKYKWGLEILKPWKYSRDLWMLGDAGSWVQFGSLCSFARWRCSVQKHWRSSSMPPVTHLY